MPINRLLVNNLFCFTGVFTSDFVSRKLINNRLKVNIYHTNCIFYRIFAENLNISVPFYSKLCNYSLVFNGTKEDGQKNFGNLKNYDKYACCIEVFVV